LKNVTDIYDLLFVEDSLGKGFCSEECILQFYDPLINHLVLELQRLKTIFEIDDSGLISLNKEDLKEFYNQTRVNPDIKMSVVNNLDQTFHIYKKEYNLNNQRYFYVMVCFVLEEKPSVVLNHFCTDSKELYDQYTKISEGEKQHPKKDISDLDNEQLVKKDIELTDDQTNNLELVKSELLAQIINLDIDDDIDEAEYYLYEQYIPLTLEEPEEKFQLVDIDENLYLFVKSFQDGPVGIYYFVFSLKITLEGLDDTEAFLPALAMPSQKAAVYEHFKSQADVLISKTTN